MAELSPMMKQYVETKAQYQDSILFFRLGDFYEMFFEDAKIASEELDLVLTGRDCGQENRAPMCGIPYHSCEGYIARLIEKGYKVAICEQTEDPSQAKGIVKREVVRIITPGTVIENDMLDEGRNSYLASVALNSSDIGLCFTDASTGESYVTSVKGEDVENRAINELSRFNPREILISDELGLYLKLQDFLNNSFEGTLTVRTNSSFDIKNTRPLLLKHFKAVSCENIGIESDSSAEIACAAAIEYLYETGVSSQIAVNKVSYYTEEQFMRFDLTAIRNLEVCETMRSKAKKGSLLWVVDKTKTAMGKRLIRGWAEKPLKSINEINLRQNAVEELCNDTILRCEAIEYMTGIRDVERLMTKTLYGSAKAIDLKNISETAHRFPLIKELLKSTQCKMLKGICDDIDTLEDITTLIDSSINENAPSALKEGGLIKDGYNNEVDELRLIMTNGTGFISDLESSERERTGIKNLRIRYNRVFGYYIEVTNSFLDKVPESYIRKQTLTNCERFITPELKDYESKVLSAKDRLIQLEYELFCEIRSKTAEAIERFQSTAAAVARLDALCSFARVAVDNNYCRPLVNNSGKINIVAGRHAVVEQVIKTPFVANDTSLDLADNRCAVITGPNMAGKSTYMRQVALIVLLAQMGCFVPAQSAEIGVVDAIYTRVGASDDLASGQSTFMVEMSEVADILKNATSNSLLILDEIGRGTSTFDGMSIARAVLEFVADKKKLGAKTLFSTHYHELTEMEDELKGVKNYNIAVKKRGDDIIFLRRIVRGGADDSYGIEVAKLSGIPNAVINRAKDILKKTVEEGVVTYKTAPINNDSLIPMEFGCDNEIIDELKALDVNTLTPIEAMSKLFELVNKAKETN